MYAAHVDDRRLRFAVSGMLWRSSLVMIDSETNSLWSHLLGECMQGPLEGRQLERLPALMADWATWREQHPATTVAKLSRTSEVFRTDVYRRPDQFVLGLSVDGKARAWPYDQLTRRTLVNDEIAGTPVLVRYDPETGTAHVYDRRLGGRTLELQQTGQGSLVDKATESTWNPESGTAVAGPLMGEQLTRLPGIVSFRRAWEAFFDESTYWSAD